MPHKPFTWIYIIFSPATNKIKVGGTSEDVSVRLSKLQREGADGDLRLLRFFRGSLENEAAIHDHLHSIGLHDHGEWFHYPPEVRADLDVYFDDYIKRIQ